MPIAECERAGKRGAHKRTELNENGSRERGGKHLRQTSRRGRTPPPYKAPRHEHIPQNSRRNGHDRTEGNVCHARRQRMAGQHERTVRAGDDCDQNLGGNQGAHAPPCPLFLMHHERNPHFPSSQTNRLHSIAHCSPRSTALTLTSGYRAASSAPRTARDRLDRAMQARRTVASNTPSHGRQSQK